MRYISCLLVGLGLMSGALGTVYAAPPAHDHGLSKLAGLDRPTLHPLAYPLKPKRLAKQVLAHHPQANQVSQITRSNLKPLVMQWHVKHADETLHIPLLPGLGYHFRVDWGDGSSVETIQGHDLKTIQHHYSKPGDYDVTLTPLSASGIPAIVYGSTQATTQDRLVVTQIKQWGDTQWLTMQAAFANCLNLDVTADDDPDLSQVRDMSYMFSQDSQLRGTPQFDHWDTSHVTNMAGLFYHAKHFNQPLGDWDTSRVSNMVAMFAGAKAFNQPINHWDTAHVTHMNAMFKNAWAFNQPLDHWNISHVQDMGNMFKGVKLSTQHYDALLRRWSRQSVHSGVVFNAGRSQYSSQARGAHRLFQGHIQDAGLKRLQASNNRIKFDPQGSVVVNRAKGEETEASFEYKVTNDYNSAVRLTAVNFKQAANDKTQVPNVTLDDANTTCDFGANANTLSAGDSCTVTLQADIKKGQLTDSKYRNDLAITDDLGITTTASQPFGIDVDQNPPAVKAFETKWNTTLSSNQANSNQIQIPLVDGKFYHFTVKWGDGQQKEYEGSSFNTISHTYDSAGTYTVTIKPQTVDDFPRINFNSILGSNKITDVQQWGNTKWTSMFGGFARCSNMDVTTDDTPNLSQASDLTGMFFVDTNLKGTAAFNDWDTSNVTDMAQLFDGASAFNQDIGDWNTNNVTNMRFMFFNASSFNQDINTHGDSWDTSNVTDMSSMFNGASAFNKDIGDWDTSNVTDMSDMFDGASDFNQDLSGWDVSNVTNHTDFALNADNWTKAKPDFPDSLLANMSER